MTLWISEIFGPTIQGEGLGAGKPAVFLRLAGCNLSCTWCDTRYSWDWKRFDPSVEAKRLAVGEVFDELYDLAAMGELIVITGGEPLLQAEALRRLIIGLNRADHAVEIETNGTRPPLGPPVAGVRYNVSPKLDNADTPNRDVHPDWRGRPDVRLKFVVSGQGDAVEIGNLVRDLAIPPSRVAVMPEGQTVERLEQTAPIALQVALDLGARYSDRLHIRLWGGERGR